jgi:hypothetical protein
MRKISNILILGLFFGAGLPLNFSVKIKCLPISGHYFSHKELISNIQMRHFFIDNSDLQISQFEHIKEFAKLHSI